VHAQIEEEIFYSAVRAAIADDALMDEALEEHAEAKATFSTPPPSVSSPSRAQAR
jgi:hypothetical protein